VSEIYEKLMVPLFKRLGGSDNDAVAIDEKTFASKAQDGCAKEAANLKS
jgi:hypothetical protein